MNIKNKPLKMDCCCWVCGSSRVELHRVSNFQGEISSADFRITDANYGVTADIYRCFECDFLFCPHIDNITDYYVTMDDQEYEQTRSERALQARSLLKRIARYKDRGTLLDVGAGSGILVEEAIKNGFQAVGLEPSSYLANQARVLGLPVEEGVLPSDKLAPEYDVITLIDVIEHVENPGDLMASIAGVMADEGICIVVTPDVKSMAARLMGRRWWHYRLAHISYFDVSTLKRLLAGAGLEVVAINRPGWYFPLNYLLTRLLSYLPGGNKLSVPGFLDNITVPLNLFDSLLLVCEKRVEARVSNEV